jgi:anti-anti-sigma regulatory factor
MMEQTKQGIVTIIKCGEHLADELVAALTGVMQGCADNGQTSLVIDLSAMQLISGRGLEFLLDCSDRFRTLGGCMKLAAPTELCAEVLSLSEVDQEIEVHREVSEAVRSFIK